MQGSQTARLKFQGARQLQRGGHGGHQHHPRRQREGQILAAGRDGIRNKTDPGKRLDVNMYEQGARMRGLKKLPTTLLDALRLLEKSKVLKEAWGAEVVASYIKLKMDEWHAYTSHLSEWEREQTLDC